MLILVLVALKKYSVAFKKPNFYIILKNS